MRKKENRESIQKGKDGKESRKTYKKSMLAAGFLAVGMFMGSTEVLAMPQEGEERVAYAKVNTCLNIRTGAGTEYGCLHSFPRKVAARYWKMREIGAVLYQTELKDMCLKTI